MREEKSKLKQIGKIVREKRKSLGLTQEKLGERAELHYSYVGQIERGDKNPSLRALEKLARALNTSVESFFEERAAYASSPQQKETWERELHWLLAKRKPEEIKLGLHLLKTLFQELDDEHT